MEEFELFEKGMFNFEEVYLSFKADTEKEMNQQKFEHLIQMRGKRRLSNEK